MEDIKLKCRFRVQCHKKDDDWGVYIFEDLENHRDITVTGTSLPTVKHLIVDLYGWWDTYKGKRTFRVHTFTVPKPEGKEQTRAYLASLKCGIGRKSFDSLWNQFGSNTLDVLQNKPEEAKKIATRCNLDALAEGLRRTRVVRELMELLGPGNALGMAALKHIADKWGERAVSKIRTNPYCLAFVGGIGFQRADEVAIHLGHNPAWSAARVHAAILYALQKLCKVDGDLFLDAHQLRDKVFRLCRNSAGKYCPTDFEFETCRNILIRKDYLVEEQGGFYEFSTFLEEQQLARNVVRLLTAPIKKQFQSSQINRFIAEYELGDGISLAGQQKEAVLRSLSNSFSIITGGAGTGKTTVIKCILWCLVNKYKEPDSMIRLMAPTGRAARRMEEVTYMNAQTIHKAASIQVEGAAQKKERIDENGNVIYHIDASTIIVDEASMMDQHVANELLTQVESGTRVILLGDPGQLPSVGAGNVLNELINSPTIPTTKLNLVFRQAETSPIVHNSLMVQKGSTDFVWCKRFRMFTYYGPETILQKAVSFYLRCIKQFSVDDVILLNPYRKGSLTVDMFNSTIQAAINPPADGKPSITVKGTTFRQGDRVMQTRNQSTGVANGDTGEILRIYKAKDSSGETNVYCEIQFEGTILETYDSKQMETVQLAYCTSVHKSQGGEWKVAIIIISPEHKRLLQRNLLYTAITRAKIGVAIFGDFGSVAYAVDNNVVVQRNTHLSAAVEQKAKEYAAEQLPKR